MIKGVLMVINGHLAFAFETRKLLTMRTHHFYLARTFIYEP